jgi:hypothetical protein
MHQGKEKMAHCSPLDILLYWRLPFVRQFLIAGIFAYKPLSSLGFAKYSVTG